MKNRLIKEFEIQNTNYEEAQRKLINWFNQNDFKITEQSDMFIKAKKGSVIGPAGQHTFEINLIKNENNTFIFHGEFYLLIRPKPLSPPVEVPYKPEGFGVKIKQGFKLTENLITTLTGDTSVLTKTLTSETNQTDDFNCPSCGTQILAGYKFCSKCGHNFAEVKPSNKNYCPKCGNQVSPDFKFCDKCGNAIKN